MNNMNYQIIGNKEKFAIEFKILNQDYNIRGNARLWINDIYVGSLEEEIDLGMLANELNTILIIKNKSLVNDIDFNIDMINLDGSDSLIDFRMIYTIIDKQVIFMWRLYENHNHAYLNYDKKFYCETVDIKLIKEVVSLFLWFVDNLNDSYKKTCLPFI